MSDRARSVPRQTRSVKGSGMRSLEDNQPDSPSPWLEKPTSASDLAPVPNPRGVSPTPWTTRQMVVGVAATLIPWLVFSIGATSLSGGAVTTSAKPLPPTLDAIGGVVAFIVSALLEAIFLIAPLLIIFSRRLPAASLRERLRWLGFRATPLLPAIVVVVVGLVIGLGGSLLYTQAIAYFHLPLQTNSDTLLQEGKSAPLTTVGILAGAALVAPFCEEVFFRGLVFVGLLKRMPLWSAVALSAIIFGVAHADLGSLLPLVIIGCALAWARWRTDSLWPGIVIHVANNATAALVLIPLLIK